MLSKTSLTGKKGIHRLIANLLHGLSPALQHRNWIGSDGRVGKGTFNKGLGNEFTSNLATQTLAVSVLDTLFRHKAAPVSEMVDRLLRESTISRNVVVLLRPSMNNKPLANECRKYTSNTGHTRKPGHHSVGRHTFSIQF